MGWYWYSGIHISPMPVVLASHPSTSLYIGCSISYPIPYLDEGKQQRMAKPLEPCTHMEYQEESPGSWIEWG